jgi:transcriptional regulator with XRE-family HTH domain
MYKNKNGSSNNIAGKNIAKIRKEITPVISQRALADKMQLFGIDLDKNAIQRIECGKRFITDIELLAFSKVLNTSLEKLFE